MRFHFTQLPVDGKSAADPLLRFLSAGVSFTVNSDAISAVDREPMTLLNPYLLAGLSLVIIPVILHLILRAKPKKLLFPALRLIQSRRQHNVRRMRLRHLLLLLLRMALLVLAVLAVARPSVPAADYRPSSADIFRLLAVCGAVAAAYFGTLRLWQSRGLPAHVQTYRRSVLRAATTVLAAVLLILFVGWPYQRRIAASITQPTLSPGSRVPVAAVLVFDTSLSMQYRYESQTRLEVAAEIAGNQLRHLPGSSRVAVCDTSTSDPVRFLGDVNRAQTRIKGLQTHPVSRPLDDRLEAALDLQIADQEQIVAAQGGVPSDRQSFLREVYVYTDLAASAWRRREASPVLQKLAKIPGLNVYLIDVGVALPANYSLTPLQLSEETLALGGELTVRAGVQSASGEPVERAVEVSVENDQDRLIKQGQATVQVTPGTATQTSFALRGLTGPVRQGEVRIVSGDPLTFDDMRYFTVRVQPPPEVLVVADDAAATRFLVDALSPPMLVKLGKARYRCTYLPSSQLDRTDLRKYPLVCLVDIARPQADDWNALSDYLVQGGGLAIFLGPRVDLASYLNPTAQPLLPGELRAALRFDPPEFLNLKAVTHPVLKRFADWGTAALTSVEIRRYWRVEPASDSTVIAEFTDPRHSAALLERSVGKGRVLQLTTAVDQRSWNDLTVGWQFVALADQMMQHLSQAAHAEINYTAGEEVIVPLGPGNPLQHYLLRKPGREQLPGEVSSGSTSLVLRDLDQLGNYRLLGADEGSKFEWAFSVNADPRESDLTRLTEEDLKQLLGEKRFSVARTLEELDRVVTPGRVGVEVLPLTLLLLVLVFAGEQMVANRFYDEQPPAAEG